MDDEKRRPMGRGSSPKKGEKPSPPRPDTSKKPAASKPSTSQKPAAAKPGAAKKPATSKPDSPSGLADRVRQVAADKQQVAENARRREAARAAREAARSRRAAQPLPPPPPRRTARERPAAAQPPRAAAPVDEALQQQISQLQHKYSTLDVKAQLGDIYSDIGQIESRLAQLPRDLNALRARGYLHSGLLEDQLAAFDEQWDGIRPKVETAMRQNARTLDTELAQAERRLNSLVTTANAAAVTAATTAVDTLSRRIDQTESTLRSQYSGLENELYKIEAAVQRMQWMMQQIDESSEIRLRETEGPLLATKAEWHQNGKEGPAGILLLTDQRLLFEQKEKVATKKFLGIIKTQSEKLQQLMLDVPIHEIETTSASEEGGFLGMGKAEILELVLGPSAPVSRARFQLKGSDSDEWAVMLKRIQTGEIDNDRAEVYVEQLAEAAQAAATFPTQCPGCFAAVPPPPRGVLSTTCQFCGSVITPQAAA